MTQPRQSEPIHASATSKAEAQPTTVALFVSDVHLDSARPRTAAAFFDFLQRHASQSQRLYLLGDIFEYWAGDDDLDAAYALKLQTALQELASIGVQCFWFAGNRDFLLGQQFAEKSHLQLLDEPHILRLDNTPPILLVHGDAECTDDVGYMQFRQMVRQSAWQQQFLARPLAERKAIIAAMRQGSKEAQATLQMSITDVNQEAIERLCGAHDCQILLHGHTHRPASHTWQQDGKAMQRLVLPDWECDTAQRGGWISINTAGQICQHQLVN